MRRPDRHRDRWPRLHDPGRGADDAGSVAVGRRHGDLPARQHRDGQDRAADSGGSQFFLVYADSTLPPDYTVFGTIDDAGLATIDGVAAAGTDDSNGAGDGKPVTPIDIQTVTVS